MYNIEYKDYDKNNIQSTRVVNDGILCIFSDQSEIYISDEELCESLEESEKDALKGDSNVENC